MDVGIVSEEPELAALRARLREEHRRDEAACVAALIADYRRLAVNSVQISAHARELVLHVRRERVHAAGVDSLMHEFSLSSQEGIALMCLAEALLRIPDAATADALIRDKIGRGDWRAHLGHSPSLFVNAAAWGLLLTGKLVATHSQDGLGDALGRLLHKGGEPLLRFAMDYAMRLLGEQFVMGADIAAALRRAVGNEGRGYRHSFDMLGEAALTTADAERYGDAYEAAIVAIGAANDGRGPIHGPGLSLKLSALHPRYARAQRRRVMQELWPRLKALCVLASNYDIGVNIDAEESERLELSLDLLAALAAEPQLAGWNGLGFVVQAYQKRAPALIDYLSALARRHGRRLMLRLVKGAYWDSEIKRAQSEGQADYPVYTRKAHSDLSYLVCAQRMLCAPDAFFPQFATHNAHTLAAVSHMARGLGVNDYEFQCLHGMGEPLYEQIVAAGGHCRIYAPVGSHASLLPYLVRRLLENGANSSFVNRLVDPAVAVDALVADPLRQVFADGQRRHPRIPLPGDLYAPQRRNSGGVDLADERALAALERDLSARFAAGLPAPPAAVDIAAVSAAVTRAAAAASGWSATPVAARAAILERAADLLEQQRHSIFALCIAEAGKTWANAVAEVREAADFCRYYAAQVRALAPPLHARGPVACISPWNFPLAIFIGQVSAALAAGRPVLAKPAEQTPRIAALAVHLLHAAGVPDDVLQLLPGAGEVVGAALCADARVSGVLFTGSTAVAHLINRRLAARASDAEVCLIAETGGQNAMIVDSSALPEQVVQDVIASAFDSAGQRCSALRVLCLQEEIAAPMLALLKAALLELRLGDPRDFATDIGPVIDAEAQARLEAHVAAMRGRGHAVFRLPLPADCAEGCFVAPTLIEIDRLGELTHEVFGPVLHVLRYAAGELDTLLAAINDSGYGLTLGVHSRIDETIARVVAQARVGNLYVNRNMVGAVVGVQPFGGEGLSGTGPKAGGPYYLQRLLDSANPPLLDGELELPGPTGERNTLRQVPRGAVLCLADDAAALARQHAAVAATGNRAVSDMREPFAAVLAQKSGVALRRLRQEVAALPGPLRPVLTPDAASGDYPLYRLLTERVLTVNTAAAGGNAGLMSLGG